MGRKIEADDKTLLYAFLSGFKPNLSSFVIGRDPQNFNDAIEAARLSELANTEAISSPTYQLFAEQFAEMKREIQKLSRREESQTAAISRSLTRQRRVSFADDGRMAVRREYSRGRYVPRGKKVHNHLGHPYHVLINIPYTDNILNLAHDIHNLFHVVGCKDFIIRDLNKHAFLSSKTAFCIQANI